MMDEETRIDPKAVASSDHFEDAMLYDYAKFLTTLTLLALGGVLTLTQTADEGVAKPGLIAFIVGSIALGGIHAVTAAARIARVELGRKSVLSARTMIKIATAFLGLGTGGFLMMWWKTL